MTMSADTDNVITILQLYPRDMNIYGDNGNVLVLAKRLEWFGYTANVVTYNVGDSLPTRVDIVIGGGGQDSGQGTIHQDLLSIQEKLQAWAADGVPMLMVCGLYQLFGHFFKTLDGTVLKGIGIFDIETHGTNERLIGNIITRSDEFGEIVGYENHSGQTFLGDDVHALASVIRGAGNNAKDGHEGARFNNVIGTYLHGSLLPKNPAIADFLIKVAIERAHGLFEPASQPDDSLVKPARDAAMKRPR